MFQPPSKFPDQFKIIFVEISDFLTEAETDQIIGRAKRVGLERSEVVDPETDIKIEPSNQNTFREWDYNKDGKIDKIEVGTPLAIRLIELGDI